MGRPAGSTSPGRGQNFKFSSPARHSWDWAQARPAFTQAREQAWPMPTSKHNFE